MVTHCWHGSLKRIVSDGQSTMPIHNIPDASITAMRVVLLESAQHLEVSVVSIRLSERLFSLVLHLFEDDIRKRMV